MICSGFCFYRGRVGFSFISVYFICYFVKNRVGMLNTYGFVFVLDLRSSIYVEVLESCLGFRLFEFCMVYVEFIVLLSYFFVRLGMVIFE